MVKYQAVFPDLQENQFLIRIHLYKGNLNQVIIKITFMKNGFSWRSGLCGIAFHTYHALWLGSIFRACVRNFDFQVQSGLKIRGCRRLCPKDLWVFAHAAPAAPVHSLIFETYNKSPWLNFGVNSSFPKHPFSVSKPIKFFPTSTLKSIESSKRKRRKLDWL